MSTKTRTVKMTIEKDFNEYSYDFLPPSAVRVDERDIQRWIDEAIANLESGEPFYMTCSGRARVIGYATDEGMGREYNITVIRDGYEEITITPKK